MPGDKRGRTEANATPSPDAVRHILRREVRRATNRSGRPDRRRAAFEDDRQLRRYHSSLNPVMSRFVKLAGAHGEDTNCVCCSLVKLHGIVHRIRPCGASISGHIHGKDVEARIAQGMPSNCNPDKERRKLLLQEFRLRGQTRSLDLQQLNPSIQSRRELPRGRKSAQASQSYAGAVDFTGT